MRRSHSFHKLQLETLETRCMLSATRLTDLPPINLSRGDEEPLIVTDRGEFYFGAPQGENNFGLFRTDGTALGTQLVNDGFVGTSARSALGLAATTLQWGDQVILTANLANEWELWITDGTSSGTRIFFEGELRDSGSPEVFPLDDTSVLVRVGEVYWKTDGTPEGTTRFEGRLNFGDSNPGTLDYRFGDDYYTVVDFSGRRSELWKIDVANGQLEKLLDANGLILSRGQFGENLYFLTRSGRRFVPWQTDGTLDGTKQIADEGQFDLRFAGRVGEDLIVPLRKDFSVDLVRLTPDGETTLLKELTGFWPLEGVISHLGFTYFLVANDETDLDDLWVTDGTPEGTRFVADLGMDFAFDRLFNSLGELDGRKIFTTRRASSTGSPVLSIDGPNAETLIEIVEADFNSGGFAALTSDRGLFGSRSGQLWATDGTQAGTALVREFDTIWSNLQVLNGRAYFMAEDDTHGIEFWSSDGTSEGTQLMRDFIPGQDSGVLPRTNIMKFQNHLLFEANDGIHGKELWQSDGTPAGTQLVRDIVPFGSTDATRPIQITEVGERAVFWADDGSEFGVELWAWEPSPRAYFERKFIEYSEDGTVLTPDGSEIVVSRTSGLGVSELTLEILADNPDITLESNEIRFVDGETTKSVGVQFPDNDVVNASQSFEIQLAPKTNAAVDQGEIVTVTVLDDEPAGDANGDGQIDFADFTILAANFGTDSDRGPEDGDFNFDGRVNFLDFLLLSNNVVA